ncbi:protein translocase subunit SecF [Kribbia dieselivorans]|uniref:protein translocase subunit SecF n=1 Tax=Kribbia dieselivorans TaxID=331526 RepID=UPI000837C5C0|nr:protein translocase subunit SecF [Kribbia dieselivorans]
MSRFSEFGTHLYTGERSIPFVGRRKTWYAISVAALLLSGLILGIKGLNMGLEFTGGTEFRVAQAKNIDNYETKATDAVRAASGAESANVTLIGGNTLRVQTQELAEQEGNGVRAELAKTFGVQQANVSVNFVGPSWGASVSRQALRALVVFLIITAVLMAAYFRTWKMAAAALLALAHDMVITVGVYALSGFEVSPATVIGFLTVLGYSLYDTVVVFDKVRENTEATFRNHRQTYAEAANLAVNQTVVRSINTTVVAVLPIIAVLVVGFWKLGPGTLLDLSLVLMIGMVVGAFSSVFLATPLLVDLRRTEPAIKELDAKVLARRAQEPREPVVAAVSVGGAVGAPAASPESAPLAESRTTSSERIDSSSDTETTDTAASDTTDTPAAGDDTTITGRTVHKYAQQPRNGRKKR